MKLVIYPAVDETRLAAIIKSAGGMTIVNAPDEPVLIVTFVPAMRYSVPSVSVVRDPLSLLAKTDPDRCRLL